MTELTIEDCTAGESWGCHFRMHTFVNKEGKPINTTNLAIGQPVKNATPGIYEGFGVIQKRDVEKRLVEIWDTELKRTWIVSWNDCWNIDRVEWQES